MKRIAVIGNPNVGKSTLINSLTGASLKEGNWHGVTVEREDRSYTYLGEKYILSDLPGIYRLRSTLAEENETLKALKVERYDGIILVLDAKAFLKGIKLLNEVLSLNLPVIAFVNFNGELKKSGGKIDEDRLNGEKSVKFFFAEANDKKRAELFKAELKAETDKKRAYKPINAALPEIFSPAGAGGGIGEIFYNPVVAYLTFIIFVFSSVYI